MHYKILSISEWAGATRTVARIQDNLDSSCPYGLMEIEIAENGEIADLVVYPAKNVRIKIIYSEIGDPIDGIVVEGEYVPIEYLQSHLKMEMHEFDRIKYTPEEEEF